MMKKQGFTLAEVLITLAIIGVVAAITLPNLIVNNQYKQVGVKLAKFMSTTEDSTRAYVIENTSFSIGNKSDAKTRRVGETDETYYTYDGSEAINKYINNNFMVKQIMDGTEAVDDNVFEMNEEAYANADVKALPTTGHIATLKDNTKIYLSMCSSTIDACKGATNDAIHKGFISATKTGSPVFVINFDPNVTGLPVVAHQNYNFVVTELGYLFPADNDDCLWKIYNANFVTNSETFEDGSVCNGDSRHAATEG